MASQVFVLRSVRTIVQLRLRRKALRFAPCPTDLDSSQAARYGITAKGSADAKVEGDVLMVGGQAFSRADALAREELVKRVEAHGFAPTMEAIAYTWFNRFAAIRYMELHGYLDHGYRVLSHPDKLARPEILDHVTDVDLPGLDKQQAVELKAA